MKWILDNIVPRQPLAVQPVLAFVVGLSVLAVVLKWFGVSYIITCIFGVVFFIVFALASEIVRQMAPPPPAVGTPISGQHASPKHTQSEIAAIVLLWAVLIFFIFLLVFILPSMFFGKPLDLRDLLNPKIISRTDFPAESNTDFPAKSNHLRKLNNPMLAEAQLKKLYPSDAGNTFEAKLTAKMGKWTEWLAKGAGAPTKNHKLYGYRIGPFPDYYWPIDAKLIFPELKAELVDGVAFLVADDASTGDLVFRQVDFLVDEDNVGSKKPDRSRRKENFISQMSINKGDELVLIIQFQSFSDSSLPRDENKYFGELSLTTADESASWREK